MIYRKGTCSECNCNDVYIVKRTHRATLCQKCNNIRLQASKGEMKPRGFRAKKKTPTGEGALFLSIWNTRPHKSFINGENLGDEANVCFFAHVLSKAQNRYPKFKLYDKNIRLLTYDQHHLWDHGCRSELKLLPEWDKLFKLEEELKEEYRKLV